MRDLEIGMRWRPRVSRMSLSSLARLTLEPVQTSSVIADASCEVMSDGSEAYSIVVVP